MHEALETLEAQGRRLDGLRVRGFPFSHEVDEFISAHDRVFVVDGDKLSVRELKTGDRLGDRIEILAGIKAGERVAMTDVEKLVDGMKVTTATTKNAE